MSVGYSFHEGAEAELNEAIDFYDLEKPGLGEAFLDEVMRAVESIRQNPASSPVIVGRVRKNVLHRFPYSLMYSVPADEVRILAVAHYRRRPFYWARRT